ncbi:hypothetical protein [Actinospongicola halichondriae]|uniref:hypothetical protein n=1 Tax=Actinospongicola halichondriae TaxID=3236844 RepID=UPI003D4E6B0E
MTTNTGIAPWATTFHREAPIGNFRRGAPARPPGRVYVLRERIEKLSEPLQDLYLDIRQQANDMTGYLYDDQCPKCGEPIARHFLLSNRVRVLGVRTGTQLFDRFRFILDAEDHGFEYVSDLWAIGQRLTKARCPAHGSFTVYPITYEDADPAVWDNEGIEA